MHTSQNDIGKYLFCKTEYIFLTINIINSGRINDIIMFLKGKNNWNLWKSWL